MYESKLKKSSINIYTVPEAKKELKRALDSKNKTDIKDINNSLFKAYINFINS